MLRIKVMRNWWIILLLLVNSQRTVFACGFYPMDDEIRYTILRPNYLPLGEFYHFNYTTSQYYDELPNSWEASSENVQAWATYFNHQFSEKDIQEFLDGYYIKKLKHQPKKNAFETALLTKEYKEVYHYFLFANQLTSLNTWTNDPWEMKKDNLVSKRNSKIRQALSKSKKSNTPELAKRYAYLAIRLAFYNQQPEKVNAIFHTHFENALEKEEVYYWALNFYTYGMDETPRKYVEIARVFSNSSEKRMAADLHFSSKFSKEELLASCQNEKERQDVIFYLLCKELDDASVSIMDYFSKDKNENRLLFLLLRETNKLEDWILTPYYNEYSPSFRSYYTWEDSIYHVERKRIKEDRLRALKLANWLKDVRFSDTRAENWRVSMQAYLYVLAESKENYASYFSYLKQSQDDEKLARFNQMVYVLMKIQLMEQPKLTDKDVQQIIQQEVALKNHKFLFALARELEYAGNTTDAAYLLSYVNGGWEGYDYENENTYAYWRTKTFQRTLYNLDFYTDYYFYLDAQYTTDQMLALLENLEMKSEDTFEQWKKEKVLSNYSRIQDLLGMKYMRANQLEKAYTVFNSIDDSLWNAWPYQQYLDANPFYTNFYNEHTPTEADTIRYTRPQLVKQLLEYIEKVKTTEGKEKAYYSVLVGNCYLNMTTYGNSWLMRRYFWTSANTYQGFEDDLEFCQPTLAKEYYLIASEATNDGKISAFALRMAARCEYYKKWDKRLQAYDWYDDIDISSGLTDNVYAKTIEEKYPDEYEPLFSNCLSFGDYFNRLRN